ncbi:carbohydrate-binding module family 1 protein [Amniculicola lignicola CBS 123094]|uniref:alpha-galactosidase n=1 Tax=Amniculicola lignicola CBS 123094 TaxID=1392246 RepID=A0A6A5W5W7_9PLEO|nr:carbohydrate-binding module family 1 protein [Amniculicola lignicola CBS 123094]
MGRAPTCRTLFWLLYTAILSSTSLAQSVFTRGQKFQIILLGVPDVSKTPLPPTDAPVWDIDLFDNDAATIANLKERGITVICYFSGGTWEDWRTDAKDFPAGDVGKVLPEWPNEKWIRTGSTKIRDIMAKRIKIASEKGCDAIDPDNIDGYQNDNGLSLKTTDAIDYMRWMSQIASSYNLSLGLKNSLDILDDVADIIDFAVNEQCAQLGECSVYTGFLASGKPVFHIEYPTSLANPQQLMNTDVCKGPGTSGMSTVLKNMQLDGKTVYCDGSVADTPVNNGASPPRPSFSIPPRPSTSKTSRASSSRSSTSTSRTSSSRLVTSSTMRTTATSRPSSSIITTTLTRPSSSSRTSTQRPTSTAGGCKSKHWDQCGGNSWQGCTVCEVRTYIFQAHTPSLVLPIRQLSHGSS